MYLNVFVPGLQYEQVIVWFFRGQSRPTAAVGRLDEPDDATLRGAIGTFSIRTPNSLGAVLKAAAQDEVMAEYPRRFAHEEAIVFVGKASGEHPAVPDRTAPQPENVTALSVVVRAA